VRTKLGKTLFVFFIFASSHLTFGQASDAVSATVTIGSGPFRAGETVPVHVELDSAPDLPDGFVQIYFAGPESVGLAANAPTEPNKKSYDIKVEIPLDAPGGQWTLSSVYVGSRDGMRHSNPKFEKQVIEVLQDKTFSLPTEARVTISPSQTQLLRQQAVEVQNRLDTLKASLRALSEPKTNARVQTLLRQNVLDADAALTVTEQRFLDLVADSKQKAAANVFFSDLHITYQTAMALTGLKAYGYSGGVIAAAYQRGSGSAFPAVAEAVFPAFEQNRLAYTVVADKGSLTFDLEVRSSPEGASVSFGRRGDSSFEALQDPTNSTIKALPYAIWTVRFEKKDFMDVERDHNPFTDQNHVLTVELVPGKK
jgi:hypothetical protein